MKTKTHTLPKRIKAYEFYNTGRTFMLNKRTYPKDAMGKVISNELIDDGFYEICYSILNIGQKWVNKVMYVHKDAYIDSNNNIYFE
ncbi:MAG: hypothetical protein GY861_29335 [bacterium]|nr:hypothetical protein [bacterium]